MSAITNTPALRTWLAQHSYADSVGVEKAADDTVAKIARQALFDGALDADQLIALCAEEDDMNVTLTKDKLFAKSGGGNVRVKNASERYSDKRYSAVHSKTGKPVFDEFGEEVSKPSQRSLALDGAYLKFAARKAGIQCEWSEHDQQLLDEAIEMHAWHGFDGEPDVTKRYEPGEIKAPLLDDSVSGGTQASPFFFDTDFTTTPLLTGELTPTVNLVPISRGRSVDSGSIATPSAVWGEGDAAVGTVFDSTGQIAALNSTVFDLSCHVLIGKNFMSDSPLAIGSILMQLIGERMGNEVERVIATGTGSQPTGVMNAAGTTSVSFGSASSTVAKFLTLLFAVPKAERANGQFVFAANETTYQRARSIATGVTGDTRLVFEMDVENFNILGRPFKIAPSMSNTQIFAGNMSKYRLYRRLGSQVSYSVEGFTLQRANELLLTVRQRWAGRVMLPSSFGVVTDAQA